MNPIRLGALYCSQRSHHSNCLPSPRSAGRGLGLKDPHETLNEFGMFVDVDVDVDVVIDADVVAVVCLDGATA